LSWRFIRTTGSAAEAMTSWLTSPIMMMIQKPNDADIFLAYIEYCLYPVVTPAT